MDLEDILLKEKKDGRIIGDVGFLLNEVNGLKEVDLGYIIHESYWGNGYATEAARACLEYGLNELKLQRIIVNMAKENIPSEKVAQKLNMTKIGEFNNPQNENKRTCIYLVDQNMK